MLDLDRWKIVDGLRWTTRPTSDPIGAVEHGNGTAEKKKLSTP